MKKTLNEETNWFDNEPHEYDNEKINSISDIRNYVLELMGNQTEEITKDQAEKISLAWSSGAKLIIVNGNIYAVHQIKSILRMKASIEFRLCIKYGFFPVDEGAIHKSWNCQSDELKSKFLEFRKQLKISGDKIVNEPKLLN